MEEALVAYLLADTGLSALVGNRVHWVQRPQGGALPCVVLRKISGSRDYHYKVPSGFVDARVQIDCMGLSYLASKQVARAVRDALSVVQFTQGSVKFEGCFYDNERDLSEENKTPVERVFNTSMDFLIKYQE